MHAINISVSRNYNAVETQTFHAFFNIQSMLQKVQFFILVHNFFTHAKTVQWLTPQAKDCLGFYLSCFGDRTAGGISFCNKNGGVFLDNKKLLLAFYRR